MMLTNPERLDNYLEIADASVNLSDAKNRLSELISGLTPEAPVLLNVRNKPRAAILDIDFYLDLLRKAEAYEHIHLADEADAGPTLSIEEGREYVRNRRAALRATRQKNESEAA